MKEVCAKRDTFAWMQLRAPCRRLLMQMHVNTDMWRLALEESGIHVQNILLQSSLSVVLFRDACRVWRNLAIKAWENSGSSASFQAKARMSCKKSQEMWSLKLSPFNELTIHSAEFHLQMYTWTTNSHSSVNMQLWHVFSSWTSLKGAGAQFKK